MCDPTYLTPDFGTDITVDCRVYWIGSWLVHRCCYRSRDLPLLLAPNTYITKALAVLCWTHGQDLPLERWEKSEEGQTRLGSELQILGILSRQYTQNEVLIRLLSKPGQ